MPEWRGRDRRSAPAPSQLAGSLERLADGQDSLRDSVHDLRGKAGVILARVERAERDLRKVESSVDGMEETVHQLRGALAAMRLLAGGSVLTAAAALIGMGKAFGWW